MHRTVDPPKQHQRKYSTGPKNKVQLYGNGTTYALPLRTLHVPFTYCGSTYKVPVKTKRANSALFRGGLLRVVTHYYARRGRVIRWLSVNKCGRTPKYLHSGALFRTNVGVSVRGYARKSVC